MIIFSTLRLAYSVLLMLLLPVIFFRLWWRGRHFPAYRQRWAERLGIVSFITSKKKPLQPIWVHAASVGEVLSSISLIQKLQDEYPNTPILITTMTPAGSQRVQACFKNELNNTVFHSYIPYDIDFIVGRFLTRVEPRCLIIIETELWPNLLYITHQKKIPIILANARLSPRSVKHYSYLGWIMKTLLNCITLVAAQSEVDAKRYANIGMPEDKIMNTGNMKFDLTLPDNLVLKGSALRQLWDKNEIHPRPVWIAASTHHGEESMILSVFLKLQKKYPKLLLLLVPRHPDRFEEVYQLCVHQKYRVLRRSALQTIAFPEIFLGDTMGDLLAYYAASDFVFLGGSLMPIGGHNFLEPAALGLPIITGPHNFNFTEISDTLVQQQGLKIVNDVVQLEAQISNFLDNPKKAHQIGQSAKRVVQQNKGALSRLIVLIKKYLS